MSPCNMYTVNNDKICMGCNDYNRFECDLTTDRDRLQAEVKDYKNKANDLFVAVLKKNVELSTMTARCKAAEERFRAEKARREAADNLIATYSYDHVAYKECECKVCVARRKYNDSITAYDKAVKGEGK